MEIFNKTTRKVKGPIRTDSRKEAHDLAVVLGAGIGFYSPQTSEGTVYTAFCFFSRCKGERTLCASLIRCE